jgi:hypothetical protein
MLDKERDCLDVGRRVSAELMSVSRETCHSWSMRRSFLLPLAGIYRRPVNTRSHFTAVDFGRPNGQRSPEPALDT